MTGLRWVQLSGAELAEFLDTGGTGVLSFARGEEPPASLPVSYGFDSSTDSFYFRLSFPPGTAKERFVDNPVSLVVCEETDEGWHSVVATGRLEELADFPDDSAAVQGMWAVEIPTVDVFDRPRDEVPFHDFRLDPDSLTGRKEVT